MLMREKQILKKACYSKSCASKYVFIGSKNPIIQFDPSESGLATLYVDYVGRDMLFSQIDRSKLTLFAFDGVKGIFIRDPQDIYISNNIRKDFGPYVKEALDREYETIDTNDKQAMKDFKAKVAVANKCQVRLFCIIATQLNSIELN